MVSLSKKTERGILRLQIVSNPDEIVVRRNKDHDSSLQTGLKYDNQAPKFKW